MDDFWSKCRFAINETLCRGPDVVRVSFFCSFPDGSVVRHYQDMIIDNIPHWIHCYMFTHPDCVDISVKFVFYKSSVTADEK